MAEMIKCKLNGKYEIILPKHRADRPEWYTEQGWEKPRLDSIHANIKKGDIVYYVGAEEGDMCGLLAKWGAELVMFEPNDKVMPNIKAIWEANKLKPATVFKGFAANVTDCHLSDFTSTNEIEGEVIHDHGFKELHDSLNIPKVKIDDMVSTLEKPVPNIITMDVEGAEWEVLQGAEQTIREYKPLIYLSLHPEFLYRIYEKYSYEVRRWIIDLGYEEKLLDYQHEVHLVYYPKGSKLND